MVIGDLVKSAITTDLHSVVLGSNPGFSTLNNAAVAQLVVARDL